MAAGSTASAGGRSAARALGSAAGDAAAATSAAPVAPEPLAEPAEPEDRAGIRGTSLGGGRVGGFPAHAVGR